MAGAGIDVKALEKLTADTVLGEHAAYGVLNQTLGVLGLDHVGCIFTLPAVVTGVRKNHAVGPLLAGHLHLLGIDDYHMVATINMGSVPRLVLAANYLGNLTGHPAQNLVFGIHQNPVFLSAGLVFVLSLVTDRIHLNKRFNCKILSPLQKGTQK